MKNENLIGRVCGFAVGIRQKRNSTTLDFLFFISEVCQCSGIFHISWSVPIGLIDSEGGGGRTPSAFQWHQESVLKSSTSLFSQRAESAIVDKQLSTSKKNPMAYFIDFCSHF